jgi:hypothetical protein
LLIGVIGRVIRLWRQSNIFSTNFCLIPTSILANDRRPRVRSSCGVRNRLIRIRASRPGKPAVRFAEAASGPFGSWWGFASRKAFYLGSAERVRLWREEDNNRSGSMQIWRMKPDGTGQEQVTPDHGHNNWFAHVSPDGPESRL